MKTDRELLELAAKAAGKELLGWDYQELFGGFICAPEHLPPMFWSPLTNDGDALHLAVKLHLRIDISDMHRDTEVSWHQEYGRKCAPGSIIEKWAEDKNAATRRAIVRAAAVIGEQMP